MVTEASLVGQLAQANSGKALDLFVTAFRMVAPTGNAGAATTCKLVLI